jgi:hypothetical protein
VGVLEAGGVDEFQIEVPQPSGAETTVARDAGPVVDNGQLASGQAVEQGGFADVRPPDDRDPQHGEERRPGRRLIAAPPARRDR